MAFAITEPDAGTNTHNLAMQATRTDGGWRLRGTKVFISGVEMAHALFVVARTGERDATTGYGRLSLFIVDVDAPRPAAHGDPPRHARRRPPVAAVLRRRRGARRLAGGQR